MTLDILVNHYREPFEIVARFLDSVEGQEFLVGDTIRVMVYTDGYEYKLDEALFAKYSVPVSYYVGNHIGVCATRNKLLDLSDADYVMFADCDDMFSESYGLSRLLTAAHETGADIIGSDYDVEQKTDAGFLYTPCKKNITRVHGKIFRRQYIIEKRIRYPDEMPFSGDMYFLYLAYHLTDNIVWLPDNFYIWKWMPESVTRGKTHYSVRTYDRFNQCYVLVIRELKRRGLTDLYRDALAARIEGSYIYWYSEIFLSAPDDLREHTKHAIIETVEEFAEEFFKIPEEMRHKKYISLLLSMRTYGPPGKYAGLDQWVNEIIQRRSESA